MCPKNPWYSPWNNVGSPKPKRTCDCPKLFQVGALYIQFQNCYPTTINISTCTKSSQQYIKSYQHISTLLSHHVHPFPSIHFSRTPAWDLKTRASAASRRRSPKSSSKGPMESTDRQSSVRTAEIPRLNHTQMLHVWYIYLQNWVIYVGQMLGFIFQHHGAYGILNHTKPWFRLGVENMNRWIGDWDSPVMAPSYLTKL